MENTHIPKTIILSVDTVDEIVKALINLGIYDNKL